MTKISTNISEEHRRAFDALTAGKDGNFVLCSCFVSGEPAAAIAAVTLCPPSQELGAPDYRIIPPSGMPDSRWGFPSGPISDSMW